MNCRKTFIALLLMPAALLQAVCNESCDYAHVSKSYLNVKPQGQSHSPELISAFRYDRIDANENDARNAGIQFVAFGGKSTDSDRLGRYFSPFGKATMKVKSSGSVNASGQEGDLLADHFNVFTTSLLGVDGLFESSISFCPEQTSYGFLMYGRKGFMQNEDAERGFWASFSMPVVRVQNDMNFTEKVTVTGGGADVTQAPIVVANMKEAFNQSEWKYGKIGCGKMSKTGVADIELKLGYEWLIHEPCHLESYIGLVIPTGNRPSGRHVFEPIVGNGHHFGITSGGAAGITFYQDVERDRQLRVEFATHTQYLFKREQMRSLDLKHKPWSRYMGVYTSQENATEASQLPQIPFQVNAQTPGINIFTRPVDVSPGFSHDMNTAFVYSSGKMYGELGWNCYARQDECVELACPFPTTIALKSLLGVGTTTVTRDITGQPTLDTFGQISLANYDSAVIKESDLDLNSAASPGYVSHSLYATIGYRCEERKYPLVAALGGSYEMGSSTNACVDRWNVWGKLGFSF